MPKDILPKTEQIVSLHALPKRTPARVVGIDDDLQQQHRLMELGLPLGSLIHVTLNKGRAGLIVARNEARLALCESVAKTIQVQPV